MNRALPLLDWEVSQPEKACIVTDEGAYTYRDVASRIRAAAASLADRVTKGTRVGLFIDSTPNFIVYEYAVFYLGGIVAPINRALKDAEVQGIVEHLGLSVVIADGPLDIDGAAHVVEVTGEIPDAATETPEVPLAEVDPEDGALLLQTSGSTGRPKGVLLTVRNLSSNYDASYRWLGIGKEDRILLTLPVFNTYALNQGINMLAMTGATLRLLRRFSPEGVARALDDIRPTFIPFVPTMVTRLYQAGIRYDEPVRIGIGAASSPANIASDAWTVFPRATLYMGYGLTEATAITSVNHIGTADDNNGDFRSAGIIVPGQQVRIGGASGEDDRGEVLIRGANVFSAYVGTTEPRPVEDGWLDTGDIGRFDENRCLHIVDRKRELIIRGGQNIYPSEIERALSSHPAVLEVSVVGAADEDLGEVPVAFVTLRRDADTDGDGLVGWLTSRLAAFKLPAQVHLIDEFPKTATGKIRKLDLKERAAAARKVRG